MKKRIFACGMAAWLCVASLAVAPASDAAEAPLTVDITVGAQQPHR
jgi:pilus assembly protein CpaC